MQFYAWMRKKHKDKDFAKGNFFGNMKHDKGFPRNADLEKKGVWFDNICRRLSNTGICREAVDVFKNCRRYYVRYERKND